MPIIRKQDLTKQEGEDPGLEVSMIVDAEKGSHSLRIGELTIPPNSRVSRHIHADTEEAMIMLEGTLEALLGRERKTIGPGHTVVAPAGTVHGFLNRSGEPARLLFVFPTHEVDRVQASGHRDTVGFASETGLAGYRSAHERPLDDR
jgi:quercetin dioxygenase-like cupin family protein